MQTAEQHVILVEDDAEISALLAPFLTRHGFRVSIHEHGGALAETLQRDRADAIIMDVMLPGEDGLSLCRRIRASSDVPIIMLTALDQDMDRIIGLEMGADDYVGKPFNPRELLARLRAVLRRSQMPARSNARDTVFNFDGWLLHFGARQLLAPDGARVPLTSMEFDLLLTFCQRPREVLTRDTLVELTQGRAVFGRGIDIQVSRIRKKIEDDPRNPTKLVTVRAGGYFFTPNVVEEPHGAVRGPA